MTDDIVSRLRELLDGPVPMSVERQDLRDAADEIERLRDEVEHWRRIAETEHAMWANNLDAGDGG